MKFSDNQERALIEIDNILKHFGNERWFIQEEVIGAGYKTMMALVNKGKLVTKEFNDIPYYQLIPKVKVTHHKMVPADK